MGWREKRVQYAGSVLFRGSIPPRAEDFEALERAGVRASRRDPGPNAHWALDLEHKDWGPAQAVCLRNAPTPPRVMIDWDPRLTPGERETARLGRSTVTVSYDGHRGDVLRDRKNLFRYLRAIMGDDGVVAIDHLAQRMWSRQALDDELLHDADLDVEALYVLHLVSPGDGQKPTWLHTHGLAEMGFFDFDVVNPAPDLVDRAGDAIRGLAFAIVEGRIQRNTPRFQLGSPGGCVRLVDAREFQRRAGPQLAALRIEADDAHNRDRCVVCEAPASFLGRWFGKVAPARFLSEAPDEMLVHLSNAATELTAERARLTYPLFRVLREHFAEFQFVCIAKLGYVIDGGQDHEREHLWFKVHQMTDDRIDGTLGNQPFQIARMREGQRGWHEVDKLTDWAIITPVGMITPRNTLPARLIRERRDEFRKLMKECRHEQA